MQFNFLVDENLEYYDYFFAEFGDIESKMGRAIQPQDVENKEILLVRSVTRVNEELLKKSKVQFVGSATIGIDHLDTSYLDKQDIHWANAAGCNAQAVAEYVITALFTLRQEIFDEKNFCLGIIGYGNVGKRLAHLANLLGWKYKVYDPFVEKLGDFPQLTWSSWLDILQCDAISIHVPLNKYGDYPTYHLFTEATFKLMNPNAILINAARGGVIKEQDLIQDIRLTNRQVVLDVFENEPQISKELLDYLTIATPHIAGYSLEGKLRGTEMLYQAFCQHYGYPIKKKITDILPPCEILFQSNLDFKIQLKQYIQQIYSIKNDFDALKASCKDGFINAQDFDALRKNYSLRREWASYGAKIDV